MDTQVADTLLGSLVDGRYRIRGRVARGGMATVYTATDERLERTVAVKIIHSAQGPEGRGFVERFTDEAKTIARLTHPNVVAVYDQGTHGGRPYLVMEYVRGRTLRDVLAERRRLNPDEALAITEQMLAAIAAAHRAGLVHRDVKPENVLVAEAPTGGVANLVDSVVKVADFGLARAVEASAHEEQGSQLMATVAYVAPELVTDGHADPRTDVYSAGIVLFEMLTGRVPYDGDRPVEVAWQHVDRDVPAPSTLVPALPKALDDLVARATRRDPGARPTDAGALLSEVQMAREELGNPNTRTAVLRRVADEPAVAQPTMMVAAVQPVERPAWARLPEGGSRAGRRRAAPAGGDLWSRLAALRTGLLGHPRGRLAAAAVVVVLGLIAAVGGWWVGVGRYTVAPQLVSLSKAEAEAQADRAGFVLRYADPRHDEQAPKDAVLQQDPVSSTRIKKGGTITLTLSLGPERFPVPDVVGKEFELAATDLADAQLKVVKGAARYDDSLPAGVVMATDPKAGTEAKPGDKVTVILSKGKAPISVPNLVGKNLNEARGILARLGLVLVEPPTVKESDKPKDEVVGQSPADGTGVEKGAQVRLEVSQGPPLVVVPRVLDLPCAQAQQVLQSQGFPVTVQFNPNGIARFQSPNENSQVPPGTPVTLGCL
ncbi:Stk1 family PASTA domain-containing Ser/Thr kinase [Micromonospora sp. WMMD558]|uniref:Stk1 family PASTA domain-containing Ser/Thr kinase n=1 Tax=unclassified Micromonospora TaxID=2617518 RepID=UPI0012B48660|nr:Stk1 family PASTA domain-containing Ser/Thr kinase [Micromonospora sp. WMMC415]QGN47665.1 Stk1 family PASTA domain-containing Ser/Thr kinase [Micromonospora sp. WMMC415]